MKKFFIAIVLMSALTMSAQTVSDNISLSPSDFGHASVSTDIHSASINGKIYYYVEVKSNPNYAVIVAKKKAYDDFKEVILPETFISADGKNLTIVAIGDKAFRKCKRIKKVDLPKTIRIIGEEAFGNTDVDDLSLKKGLVKIGDRAFLNNDLKDIHIPEGVQEIGMEAFYCFKSTIFQRNSSGTLYIPKSVYRIGDHAFAMTRNGWGVWFNSKREILCLPDHVNLDNCKDMGISREPVEEYLKGE